MQPHCSAIHDHSIAMDSIINDQCRLISDKRYILAEPSQKGERAILVYGYIHTYIYGYRYGEGQPTRGHTHRFDVGSYSWLYIISG
jgi:hypothetical protein